MSEAWAMGCLLDPYARCVSRLSVHVIHSRDETMSVLGVRDLSVNSMRLGYIIHSTDLHD